MSLKIKLPKPSLYQEKVCSLFAENCYQTNKDEYERRNQTKKEKIISDIWIGKMCEYAVFNYLYAAGKKPTPPDIVIYPPKSKTFDEDINCSGNLIHVKSCMKVDNYDPSWLFQPNDPLTIRPRDNDYIFFVLAELPNEWSGMILPAKELIGKYEKPVAAYLDKKVIYQSSII